MIEAEHQHALGGVAHVLPEIGIVGDAGRIVDQGLLGRRDALFVELVEQDVGRGRKHDFDHHIGRIGLQRQQRREKVLSGAIQRLVLVVDAGRALLDLVAEQLGEPDAVIRVLGEGDDAFCPQRLHGVGHGDGDAAVIIAGIENFRIGLVADGVGPAVGVDVGNLEAMRHLDCRQHRRTLVLADDGDDLVAGDQLFDRGARLLGDSLGVLKNEFDRPAQHAARVVDDLGCDLDPVLDLGALRDRTGRRLGDGDADFDRVGGDGGLGKREQAGGQRQRAEATRPGDGLIAHNSPPWNGHFCVARIDE